MTDYLEKIDGLLHKLFPICRSITGAGNRETLRILQEIVPLKILEYPSGSPVFDWLIPEEWEIHGGFIKNFRGELVVDFHQNNLHVMNYSRAVQGEKSLEELKPHLHYLQKLPDAIPYRTTYYNNDWGFCLTYQQYKSLVEDGGPFKILIDTGFKKGSLTIGEVLIEGKNSEEVLISTYICHPSMANDNLSGMILTAFLAKELLSRKKLNRSYRIIFVPETIGAITYCAMNERVMKAIDVGLVVTTVGGPGKFGYKQSFNENHVINRLIEETFREAGYDFTTYPFDIHGSDERQYSSPGFRINTATISKDKYYEYPGYHTSLDSLDFVKAEYIYQTLLLYLKLIDKLELENILSKTEFEKRPKKLDCSGENIIYLSRNPNCEVMLSKHDLYPKNGGGLLPAGNNTSELDMILWVLFFCDGQGSINELSKKINVPFKELQRATALLEEKGLLERVLVPKP